MRKTAKMIAAQSIKKSPKRRQDEELFDDADLKFKTIFDAASVGILIAQANYRNFLYANDKMCEMMGYAKDEILKLSVSDIHPEVFLPYIFEQFDKMADKEISEAHDLPFLRKDGSVFLADGNALYITFHGKECLVGIFREVTEIKQKENALRKSEEQYATLVDAIHDLVIHTDLNGQIVSVNDYGLKVSGYSREEMEGRSIFNFIPSEYQSRAIQNTLRIIEGSSASPHEYELIMKDGRTPLFEVHGNLLREEDGTPYAYVMMCRDVTERRIVEEKLREEELRFRALTEQSSDIILLVDRKGIITYENKAVEEHLGYRAEERIGISLTDYMHPDDVESNINEYEKIYNDVNVPVLRKEVRLRHRDGSWRIFEEVAVGLSKGNKVGSIIVNLRDITGRKKAEEILAKSERKFFSTFHLNPSSMAISEVETGKFVDVNQSLSRWTGYSREEVIGKSALDLQIWVNHEDRERITGELRKEGEVNGAEVLMRMKNGNISNVLFSARYIEIDQKRYLLTLAQDITEMKKAQETLKISEENFRRSLDDSPLGVRIISDDSKTSYANRALQDIFGYEDIEELKKTTAKDLYTPASYAEFLVRRDKRRRGEDVPSEYEVDIVRRNGDIRHLQVFLKDILWNGEAQSLILYNDITGRKKAEELLKQSEAKYRLLADHMKDQVWLMDLNYQWIYVSPSLEKLSGYSLEELKKTPMRKIMTEKSFHEAKEIFSKELPKALAVPSIYVFNRMMEIESVCKDGRIIWNEVTFSFIRDENGKPVYILGEGREITERKIAEQKLQQTLDSLKKAVGTTIQVLVSALESRDPYTAGHQHRSANLACAIAAEMGLTDDKIEGIRMAGAIHDIGKLSVPAEILAKPSRLTDLEFALVKEHSQNGFEMLKNVESPWPLADIVCQHHERINGSGYPHNLKNEDILIEARIMAVADVVEAMASHRPYRAALGIDAAINEIEKNRGILYDEDVVDAFLRLIREKGYQLT